MQEFTSIGLHDSGTDDDITLKSAGLCSWSSNARLVTIASRRSDNLFVQAAGKLNLGLH